MVTQDEPFGVDMDDRLHPVVARVEPALAGTPPGVPPLGGTLAPLAGVQIVDLPKERLQVEAAGVGGVGGKGSAVTTTTTPTGGRPQ
jgi:hypothetical protein